MKLERETIQIRLTEDQKALIKKKSEEEHQSMTEWVLGKVLKDQESVASAALQQNIVRALCELNCRMEQMDGIQDRKLIREWEAGVWQFLKS